MHSLWCIGHATLVMVTLQSFGECSNLTYELPLRGIWFRSHKTSSQDNLSLNLHSINITNPTSSLCVCVCVCVCVHAHTYVWVKGKKVNHVLYIRLKIFSTYCSQRFYTMIKAYQPQFRNCGSWPCFPGLVGIVKTKWNLEVAKILVLKTKEK